MLAPPYEGYSNAVCFPPLFTAPTPIVMGVWIAVSLAVRTPAHTPLL